MQMKRLLTGIAIMTGLLAVATAGTSRAAEPPTPKASTGAGEIQVFGYSKFCLTASGTQNAPVKVSRCLGTSSAAYGIQAWGVSALPDFKIAIISRAEDDKVWCLGVDSSTDDAITYNCSGDEPEANPLILVLHHVAGSIFQIENPQGRILVVDTTQLKLKIGRVLPVYWAPPAQAKKLPYNTWILPTLYPHGKCTKACMQDLPGLAA
jgi:hypothetical protein